jgi:transcriptional regulator with XRE-family HTH domain
MTGAELRAWFGSRLRAAREDRDLSQSQLAERAGLAPQAVGAFESGLRFPRAGSLVVLADALDLSVAELFRDPASSVREAHSRYAGDVVVERIVRLLHGRPLRQLELIESIARLLVEAGEAHRR